MKMGLKEWVRNLYQQHYTYEEQVKFLEKCGIVILDRPKALHQLKHVGLGTLMPYLCYFWYYDENGNGAIKSLKRTPINNAKVTSSFSNSRKHPVLGYTRAHKGVDFRASTGTPIPAAGSGRVVARSYNRGHGNYVKIRHNGSYETLYAHMSRFAKGVVVGTTVKQGQTIGYVGSTGLSTGPHLHYEIIKDGKHVNPMTVKLPAINNLDKEDKKKFLEYRKALDKGMGQLSKNPNWFIQL